MEFVWFWLVAIMITGYVVLDGFDLGAGALHLFIARSDEERRTVVRTIGPVWDGNEVWLVIVGGALFAGFPPVYATLFSGFYNFCMAFLACLIFRAVAIEFRSKREGKGWRFTWDTVFALASLCIAFGLGIAIGNLMNGIPLDKEKDFIGYFSLFFRPYPLLIGLFTVSLLLMHGSLYLTMKTEGALHKRLRRWSKRCIFFFLLLYLVTTVVTWITAPHMVDRFKIEPWYLIVPGFAFLAILHVLHFFNRGKDGLAFLSSCGCIALLFFTYGIGTFPYFIRSTVNTAENSLTFLNSAASPLTLKVLLIIVAIGIPLVLAYGTIIYRIFRGKVKIGPTSY